jgi:hypothetical protein
MTQSPPQSDALIATAVLGQQIDSFNRSDIGRYLQARAKKVYNAAVEDFKRVDPHDAAAVSKVQADMWKAEAFMGWLEQGIQEGLTSLGILEGLDDETEIL